MSHVGSHPANLSSRNLLGVRVDVTSYDDACARVLKWVREGTSRFICLCNVHMIMEAHDDPEFRTVVNEADLVTADGQPLVWTLRLLKEPEASRVYGPDLMLSLCATAERAGIPVGLYGSTGGVVERVLHALRKRFPLLRVPYAHAPPLGTPGLSETELAQMRASGIRILFVGLGCPKQERWMAEHSGRLTAVMIGVGAAFDFLAGTKPQAPRLLQRAGLEWAFRLATEPRRLTRRYLMHNPRFIVLILRQLVAQGRRS